MKVIVFGRSKTLRRKNQNIFLDFYRTTKFIWCKILFSINNEINKSNKKTTIVL